MSSSQRVARLRRDMGAASETVASPSFSGGTAETTATTERRPRSTRTAAVRASTLIAQAAHGTLRRSSRTTSAARSGVERTRGTVTTSSSSSSSSATRGTKETPIVLDDDDNDNDNGLDDCDLKPAAKPVVGGVIVAGADEKPPADFTCAICLDAPPSMAEVASISGCTHRFCFECIDKWAETENRCPCCKERFRTIDRCVALPPTPEPSAATGRRPKRKKSAAAGNGRNTRARTGGGAPSPARNRRVNSRTVEDRTQQSSSGFPINAAIVEQILASFSNFGGPGQVTFGTSADGRPAIRMIRPARYSESGGMMGVMEMILPDDLATGGSQTASTARGGAATAGGRGSSPTRSGRFRLTRTPNGSSRRGSSSTGSASGRTRSSFPPAEGTEVESAGVARASGVSNARPRGSLTRPVSAASARASSAIGRAAGLRAARQTASGFTGVFSTLGGSSSTSGSRSRRSSGSADDSAAGETTGGNSFSSRVAYRLISRDRASANRRTAGGGGASGSENNDDNEPIVID